MAEHVTRCPHCQTSFRVRDEHLSVARGNVRCGSCLQVFNATEHFVVEKPVTPPPAPVPPVLATPVEQPTAAANVASAAGVVAAATVASEAKPAAPAAKAIEDDYSGVNLDDQTEVSADELFDNMFGSFDEDEPAEPDNVFDLIDAKEQAQSVPTSSFVLSQKESFQDAYAAMRNPKPAESIIPAPEPEVSDDDDLLIHDDMDEDHIADDPFADLGLREPEQRKRPAPLASIDIDESLLDMVEPEHHLVSPRKKVEQADPDEAWAHALLDEDDDDEPPEAIRRELGLASQKAAANVQPAVAPRVAPPSAPGPAAVTPPASKPAATSAGATAAVTRSQPVAAKAAATATPTRREPVNFELAPEQQDAPEADESLLGAPLTDKTPKPAPVKPRELAGSLQAEPLKLELPRRSRIAAGWAWGSVALLLLGACQVFYFNFGEWSRTQQWRPFYTQVCTYVGCTLPTVQDIKTMKASQLVVRSHPSLANALVVDSLLENEADFAQPFPDLTLIFKDLNEHVVASRRFSPDEYLSGEVAGTQSMPSQTEVHVALEILDPGQNAVSYSIQLVANQ